MSTTHDVTRMSKVDTAWFHMDSPTNHMTVTAVLLFDETVDETRMRKVMDARLLPFERFRQRVVTPLTHLGEPEWELVEDFDVDDHVEHVTLPRPGGDAELQDLVGQLMSIPLDPTKPLWQMHIVDGYGGGTAIVIRMHHCIADGIALVRLLLSLTDTERDAEPDGGIPGWKRCHAATVDHHRRPRQGAAGLALSGARGAWRTLLHPERGVRLVRSAADGLTAFVRVSTLPTEPHMSLNGPLGMRKKVAWSKPILVGDVKAIAHLVGGTINDVLVTATAGSVRQYLLGRGDDVDGLVIHATVPVNLRAAGEDIELGNRFGLVYPALPIGVAEPLGRLHAVKEQMDTLKGSSEALMAIGVLEIMGRIPGPLERAALDLYTSKSTMVLTNVPGPRTALYYAGSPLRRIIAWAPPSGSLSMSVSIYSYAGEVTIGVAVDAGLVPDPERIVDGVHSELEALGEAARHQPAPPGDRRRRPARPSARRPAGRVQPPLAVHHGP